MVHRLALAVALAVCAGPGIAQEAGAAARDAATALSEAARLLDDAESARDRVAALTRTVRAYEDGLAALRDGVRAAAIREETLRRKLDAEEAEITRLLGVLSAQAGTDGPQTLLHPAGPLGTARAGLLVAAVAPALAGQAAGLRADLQEVATLRAVQQEAAERLAQGLAGAQAARTALSQAIAGRTDLPRRFDPDPVAVEVLLSVAGTVDAFADGLDQIGDGALPGQSRPLARPLPLPVRGTLLRAPGERDAAGVARPGMVLATDPAALVTAPAASTLRYAGPLLDYGLVAILEPRPDLLIVLAGMEALFVETGHVLPAGDPVGLMGGRLESLSPSGEEGGGGRSETLYIEVRDGNTPSDPLTWFAIEKG
jgi:septal ring factor EnvC (AmiA/AmiB activator)